MRTDFLPFSRPSITEEDIAAVGDVLRSGWITTGPKSAEFERQLCEYVGCKGAVALTSATAGLHLLFEAFKIGPGDEVITPSMTWVSIANLLKLRGATPVFCDIDRDTLMITPQTVEAAITPRTKMIVPVHYAGSAVDLEPLRRIAAQKRIALVEDAAHAVGTEYRGERIGRQGTAIFSLHPIKNITTGEGGMFCSDDLELVERIRRLKFHGLGVDAFDRSMQGRSPQAEVIEPGYKYNLPDMCAVLGLRQLARLDDLISKRAALAARYRQLLAGVEEIRPLADPPYPIRHAWHLFIVRVEPGAAGITRDDFMEALKRRNIGTGIHFRAIHLQKYYASLPGCGRGMFPNTEWNSERICSLPLFPDMTPDDVDDVVRAIKEVLCRK